MRARTPLALASALALGALIASGTATARADRGPAVLDPSPVAPPGSVPAPLVEIARATRDRPLAARVEALSGALLGAPYLLDGLGEGAPPDADPLARYDGFDCQTFVEEVLALTLALDPLDAGRVRRSLRYGDAPPSFAARRHFTELQWAPGLIRDGWVRDRTRSLGPTRALHLTVDAAFWRAWPGRDRFAAIPDAQLPTGEQRLDVLPVPAAIAAIDDIPPGSVILLVREPKPGNPIWTTHMGLALPGGRLRHASLTAGRVVDQDLATYLRDGAAWRGWPIAGIAVLEPYETGPR
jgi:hypothetical protein